MGPKIWWNNRSIAVHLSLSPSILFWSISVHHRQSWSVSVHVSWSVVVYLGPCRSMSVDFGAFWLDLVYLGPFWSVSVCIAQMYPRTKFHVNTSSTGWPKKTVPTFLLILSAIFIPSIQNFRCSRSYLWMVYPLSFNDVK